MQVFESVSAHEQVVFGHDPASGLRCIIAIHSTALGPALGGTRMHPYASEEEALADVLRLAEGMTYKAACAGLDLGGGKAVIIGDPATDKSERLLRAFGRQVAALGGRYVTACDVGTTTADLSLVKRETRWATGALEVDGGSGDSGVHTALGVLSAITACAEEVFGTADLSARHVAVQGLGKVGGRLAGHLVEAGAKVTVADVDRDRAEALADRLAVDVVDPDDVLLVDADVVSPNALGGVLTEALVPRLSCRVVAGGANNQLATPAAGEALADAGILYAPDFVANAGGIIQVGDELHPSGYDARRVAARTAEIGARVHEVVATARRDGVSTAEAAVTVARQRIAAVGGLRGFLLPG